MTAGPLYEQMPPSISRILGAGVSMWVVMSRTISCSRAYASIQKDDRVAITKNPAAAYAPIRTPKVRRRQAGRRTAAAINPKPPTAVIAAPGGEGFEGRIP